MLTYTLFKSRSMLLSATSRKGQSDADLQPVQNPKHTLVSCKQEVSARCWLTFCSKSKACSCQQQSGRSSLMLTYTLLKSQSMILSAASSKCEEFWLTYCSKPRPCSCQQQAGKASQMLTYTLFKNQSMLLSATSRKHELNSDLHAVEEPEHALVSNKQEGPVRCWLTTYSKPRAHSCQLQGGRSSQMLTYILFKIQCMLF